MCEACVSFEIFIVYLCPFYSYFCYFSVTLKWLCVCTVSKWINLAFLQTNLQFWFFDLRKHTVKFVLDNWNIRSMWPIKKQGRQGVHHPAGCWVVREDWSRSQSKALLSAHHVVNLVWHGDVVATAVGSLLDGDGVVLASSILSWMLLQSRISEKHGDSKSLGTIHSWYIQAVNKHVN